jgi:hypothetical protein
MPLFVPPGRIVPDASALTALRLFIGPTRLPARREYTEPDASGPTVRSSAGDINPAPNPSLSIVAATTLSRSGCGIAGRVAARRIARLAGAILTDLIMHRVLKAVRLKSNPTPKGAVFRCN